MTNCDLLRLLEFMTLIARNPPGWLPYVNTKELLKDFNEEFNAYFGDPE